MPFGFVRTHVIPLVALRVHCNDAEGRRLSDSYRDGLRLGRNFRIDTRIRSEYFHILHFVDDVVNIAPIFRGIVILVILLSICPVRFGRLLILIISILFFRYVAGVVFFFHILAVVYFIVHFIDNDVISEHLHWQGNGQKQYD